MTHQRFIVPDLPSADEVLPFLRQMDENRWYSNFGPLANEFESRFAKKMAEAHGASEPHHCVVMTSGYHALSVGMRLSGVQAGSTVLIPSVTFPACPLAVQNLGAEPVLGDVDSESWLLTPAIAKAAAQKQKIDAVMPVCLYGMPVSAQEWDAFTEETGIPVIIDAAAAVETQRYLKKGFVAHSLHALKPFGIGEGGILVVPGREEAAQARQVINFGMITRITHRGGENAKMSEYHAAVALAQLQRWEGIKERRRGVLARYLGALEKEPRVIPHPDLKQTVPSCLMVSMITGLLSPLFDLLVARGVAVHRTYLPPLYSHPYFADLPMLDSRGNKVEDPSLMKGAEAMQEGVLGLPFHAFMSDEEIHQTVKILSECLDETTDHLRKTG